MNFTLDIHYIGNDTPKTVNGIAADIVAFESKFDMSMSKLQKDVKLTHLMFLAYAVEKRTGATTDEFEKWLESVEIVTAASPK
jgi:hypothetical protein|tara:strand:- start:262 stop:510 length:249 start_codon:yes stop_codon:yes gene_type:complete